MYVSLIHEASVIQDQYRSIQDNVICCLCHGILSKGHPKKQWNLNIFMGRFDEV